jgi:hypothetical protein
MPEPRFDYGEMFTGTPKLSAIDPELFRYDEELVKRQQAEELIPTALTPKVDYSTGGAVPPVLSPTPRPQPTFDLQGLVKGMSVPIGKMAAELMGGERTTAGRIGNILAGSSQSMLLNENLKKMLQQYMAGEGGSKSNFPSDQQFGVGDLEAAGLTPEQLGGIYQAGLKTRKEERAWPIDRMGAIADIHNKIIMGDYHEAQIPYIKAQLDKMRMETGLMPAETMAKIMEKQAMMKKIIADTQRIEMESEYKLPAEIEQMRASAAYSKAGVPLRQVEAWEKSPQGIGYKSFMETLGKNTTDKFIEIPLGNKTIVYSPITKQVVAEFNTGLKPGEIGKPPQAHSESFARFLAMSDFTELAAKDLMARYPKEEQQKAYQAMQDLRDLMKDQRTADMAFPALRGSLSDKNKKLFDQALDVYMKTTSTGGSITDAGEKVREIISGRSLTTTPGTAGDFSTNPRAKIPPKGKPLVDFDEMISTATKEIPNAMTDSQFEEWSYKKFSEPKRISREVHKAVVRKGIANLRGKTPGGP